MRARRGGRASPHPAREEGGESALTRAYPNQDTCGAILARLTEVQKERRKLLVHEAVPDWKSQEQLDHYYELEDQAEELEARLRAAAEQAFPLESSDGAPIQENRDPRIWLDEQIDDLRALPTGKSGRWTLSG